MTGATCPPVLADRLRDLVGPANVLLDPDVRRTYEVDWTGRFDGRAAAVVRPATTDEVAAVLRACADHRLPVVPQGGNTGLVGGGVPLHGEIVLSLRRMTALDPVDPVTGQVTVEAGVTLAALQEHVRAGGFEVGIDFGARDSATVGGMIATNAGGARAFRYGSMRQQVVGVEAVLSTGAVVRHLSGLSKDNTGYDYAGLLAGSEGTLAVVTRARLRLHPRRQCLATALVALSSIDDVAPAFATLRHHAPSLDAAEFLTRECLELVCDHAGHPRPFDDDHPVYLVVEAAATSDPLDELADALGALGSTARDTAVAAEPQRRRELWRYRDSIGEAINALGVPYKLDVSVPLAELARFIAATHELVARHAPARVLCFGHVGDGNVHVNVVEAPDGAALEDGVLRLAVAHGGTISAEHGVGSAKRAWLPLVRSPDELALFAAVRGALDPHGLLNPHVLVPSSGILYT